MSGDTGFLAWPFFTDGHREYAMRLAEFAARELAGFEHAPEEDQALDASCREIARRLGAAGFLEPCCIMDPAGRFDLRKLALSRDTLARQAGLADFVFGMQGLGTGPVSLFGSAAQRQQVLPGVVSGAQLGAFALSEPEAGSDVAAMTTMARRDGDGWRLDGVKTWISNGGLADHYVVFARSGEAPGSRGLSAFLVDRGTPGLEIEARIRVIAPHPLATIRLRDCRLPAAALIGEPGQGFTIAMATLDVFRTTVGAAALGFARRALDEAIHRVRERSVFGRRLADFQLTQARIADMALEVDTAALLVYRAAWARDTGDRRITREAAMAKLHATEAAQRVIDSAVQLFGGLGVVHGTPVESLYREIRALRIYEGTSEIQKLVIASTLLGKGS